MQLRFKEEEGVKLIPKKGLYGERGFPVLGHFEYTSERFPLKMQR